MTTTDHKKVVELQTLNNFVRNSNYLEFEVAQNGALVMSSTLPGNFSVAH